jgi:hypothetical protein
MNLIRIFINENNMKDMKRYFFSLFILSLFLMPLSAQKANKSTKTGKWGFMNGSTWVVEPKFENYDPANAFGGRKYAIVQFQGKWGAVGADGKYYSKPVFATKELALRAAKLAVTGGDKSKFLYPVYDQTYTRWGFVDYTGEMYLRPVYEEVDDANNFSKGLPYSIVKQDGQWGCLDREGVMFINPYFTSKEEAKKAVTEWTNKAVLGENIYIGMKGSVKKIGFVNYLGNWVMKPVFDNVDKASMFNATTYYAVVKYKGRWCAIDRAGNFVVKPQYATMAEAKAAAAAWQKRTPNAKVSAANVPNVESFTYKNPNLAAQEPPQKKTTPVTPVTPVNNNNNNNSGTTTKVAGAPTIHIISPKNGSQYSNTEVTFIYETTTYDGSNPEIIAYINGELYPTTKGVKRVGKQITLTLPRVADCRVQLIAKDNKGQNSDPAVVLLHYRGDRPKPSLHVFAVGISDYDQSDLKLQHAAKDAEDFMNTVKNCNLSQYKQIKTTNLIKDKSGTDKNIKKGLSSLVNTVDQGDVVLLFFSGHGAKEGAETYFLSCNAESNDLFATAVDFDIIKSALKRLKDRKCRIIIFMDACHSGSMYGVKGTTETFSLADPDIIGFYSSTEAQKSNESEQWENGIFTKALLDGIKGAAVDENGNVTLDALELYIRNQVRNATNGRQMPIFENRQGNFILFEKK